MSNGVKMVDIFFREYASVIMQNFKSFLENDMYVDLIFICANKTKVKAHQVVISYLSKFLSDIMIDNQYYTNSRIVYICIPDMKPRIMENIIRFVYSGHITLISNDINEFHESMKLLGMPACSFTPPSQSISIREIRHICATKINEGQNKNLRQKSASSQERTVNTNDEIESQSYAPVISGVVSLYSHDLSLPQQLSNTSNCTLPSPPREDSESIRRIAEDVFLRLTKMGSLPLQSACNSNRKVRGRTNSVGVRITRSVLKKSKIEFPARNRNKRMLKRRSTVHQDDNAVVRA